LPITGPDSARRGLKAIQCNSTATLEGSQERVEIGQLEGRAYKGYGKGDSDNSPQARSKIGSQASVE